MAETNKQLIGSQVPGARVAVPVVALAPPAGRRGSSEHYAAGATGSRRSFHWAPRWRALTGTASPLLLDVEAQVVVERRKRAGLAPGVDRERIMSLEHDTSEAERVPPVAGAAPF